MPVPRRRVTDGPASLIAHAAPYVNGSMVFRIALVLGVTLAIASSALADAAVRLSAMPGHPARPRVDATLVGQGTWSKPLRRWDNRIRYARTTAELEKLLPYLEPAHRTSVRRLDLTRYGVLLVLHVPIGGTISPGPVFWIDPDGMSVALEVFPRTCAGTCHIGNRLYVLYKVRKASVRRAVTRLYIEEYVQDYRQTP